MKRVNRKLCWRRCCFAFVVGRRIGTALPAGRRGSAAGGPRGDSAAGVLLRGYDPVTAYFPQPAGRAQRRMPMMARSDLARWCRRWPGAWVWVDQRTLQFRPCRALAAARPLSVQRRGTDAHADHHDVGAAAMVPSPGTESLRPFRTIT